MRKIHQNIPLRFAPHDWTVEETTFCEIDNKFQETIFCLGNGYLGVRGVFEEGYYGFVGNTIPATVINGIYEYHDLHHIWARPGFPTRQHAIINQPEAFQAHLYVNGERILMHPGKVSGYKRVLDMQHGLLSREYVYTAGDGTQVRLHFERFVSLAERHTAVMRISLSADRDCRLRVCSRLDGQVKATGYRNEEFGYYVMDEFNCGAPRAEDGILSVTNTIKRSGFTVSTAQADRMAGLVPAETHDGYFCVCHEYDINAHVGETYTLEKAICYTTDRDDAQPEDFVRTLAKAQLTRGWDVLYAEHRAAWLSFWNEVGVELSGDTAILQGVRFAMFHLNQGAGRDGITNISANCLTGCSYCGWTFWDTEIFMSPMFLYTQPEIAKKFLIYRYNTLDKSRERARQMDDQGALFAWSTINGEECAWIFEAATAQYHIDTDVYYAIERYMQVTHDEDFMVNYGAEILFETSKCLAHRGNFIKYKGGKFCINGVCGPDEYSPIVNNNCYTNWLCRKMFYYTLDNARLLREKYPKKYVELLQKCGVDDEEMALWQRAADNMYIPYNEELQLYLQDDQILDRDPIDIESIPVEKLPLLNHLHPLNLWRLQVIKQADIVLLIYLCGEDFSPEMKKKIFDFYEPLTIHDSSLSAGIHSIVATEIGYTDEAYGYFRQTARMDLDNVNRNTDIGVHSACMGSAWLILTGGFACMRLYGGKHHFSPFIPEQWGHYAFNLRFDGAKMNVRVEHSGTTYTLLEGEEISFFHGESEVTLTKQMPARRFAS